MSTVPALTRPTRRSHPRRWALVVGAAVAVATGLTACGGDGDAAVRLSAAGEAGRQLALRSGCASCHGNNGEGRVAPAFVGLFGSTQEFDDGTTAVADEAYLIESIVDPNAKKVAGYNLPMPGNNLSDEEVASIVAYIRELAEPTGTTAP